MNDQEPPIGGDTSPRRAVETIIEIFDRYKIDPVGRGRYAPEMLEAYWAGSRAGREAMREEAAQALDAQAEFQRSGLQADEWENAAHWLRTKLPLAPEESATPNEATPNATEEEK